MDEDERIEKSPQERKTEDLPDLPAGPQEVHDESGLVNRETSNVNVTVRFFATFKILYT